MKKKELKENVIKAIQKAIENPIKCTKYGPDNEYLFKVKFQSEEELEYFYDILEDKETAYNYLFETRGYYFHTSLVNDDEPFTENCYCTYYGLLINVRKDYYELEFSLGVAEVHNPNQLEKETNAALHSRLNKLKTDIDNELSGVKPTDGIAKYRNEAIKIIDEVITHLSADEIRPAIDTFENLEDQLRKLAIEVTKSLNIKK